MDIHDTQLLIRDVILAGSWNLSRLYTPLPDDVKGMILARDCSMNARVSDCLVWSMDTSGIYTARAGYNWLIQERLDPLLAFDWQWIWKLKGPFKINFMLWLCCRNSLPVNQLRFNRNMAASPLCACCNLYPETILHCLRDFWFARRVWYQMGLNPSHASFGAGEPREWLKRVLVGAEASGLSTILGIWTARNQATMAQNIIPEEKLLRLIQEQRQLLLRLWPPSQLPSQPRLVSWIAPVALAIAINCDGSSLGVPLRSGFGGCLRHANGAWITGFHGYGGQGTMLHMELLAICYGLDIAWSLGHRQIECFSDSLLAVGLIKKPPDQFHEEAVLVSSILDLLRCDWVVQVAHVLRERNACADFLAKAGATQNQDFLLLQDPPPGMEHILVADSLGYVTVRQ